MPYRMPIFMTMIADAILIDDSTAVVWSSGLFDHSMVPAHAITSLLHAFDLDALPPSLRP